MDNDPAIRHISDTRLQQRLHNKAAHYLARYASTTARLETVLRRFATRKIGALPPDQLERCIKQVIESCIAAGYVDDSAFIRNRFRAARQSGHSIRMVTQKLIAAGIPAEIIEAERIAMFASQAQDESDINYHSQDMPPASMNEIELVAAIQFARKKKLACFAEPDTGKDQFVVKNSTLGRLARRGFSYDICAALLAFDDADAALARADEISARIPPALS